MTGVRDTRTLGTIRGRERKQGKKRPRKKKNTTVVETMNEMMVLFSFWPKNLTSF